MLFADIFSAITEGASDIPTHMTAIELPGGAVFLVGTILFFPAGGNSLLFRLLVDKQEIEIFLGVFGNVPPALFVAVDGPDGDS